MAGVLGMRGCLKGTGPEPLKPIPEESFMELSNILLTDIPNSLPALGMVENVIRWRQIDNIPADQKLYAPFGDFKNGTCVGIYDTGSFQAITIYSRDAEDRKMREALLTTGLINWGSGEKKLSLFMEISEELIPMVKEAASKNNTNLKAFCDPTVQFWMEIERALKIDLRCPPGVKLGPLATEHIPYLDQYWHYRFDGSHEYLSILLERNFGIGAFVEGNEMPVAWTVLSQNSYMTMVYTLEAYRRNGYAELVCNAMAKKLAEIGVYPRADVIENNAASVKLFTKLGFKSSLVVHQIHLESR